ncbi:MAG: helix-turn-helix domain-containing protein [Burkholderiales bacterium]|nr:helix-turn-helix domain-containing protein [Burkholderiales bacterium]
MPGVDAVRADARRRVPEAARPGFVATLAKGLEVLAAFERVELLGNQELVEITGLPKATVSRLTGTLAALGYLRLDEGTRKYSIGARVLGLGASVQRHLGLQRVARPRMQALAEEFGLSVILATRERRSMVMIEVVRPPRVARAAYTDGGSHVSLRDTSLGLAYLVAVPLAERVRLLESLRRAHPNDWDAVRVDVERAHREVARRGFVVSRRGRDGAVAGVSAPLALGERGVFVFGCAGPSTALSTAHLTNIVGPRLVRQVREVADHLTDGVMAAAPARKRRAAG